MSTKTRKQSKRKSMKKHIVGLKELRVNMEQYIDAVNRGERVTVVRRSKPIFTLISPDDDEDQWETIIDFTENGTMPGVDAKELLATMREMHGQK